MVENAFESSARLAILHKPMHTMIVLNVQSNICINNHIAFIPFKNEKLLVILLLLIIEETIIGIEITIILINVTKKLDIISAKYNCDLVMEVKITSVTWFPFSYAT